MVRWPLTPKKDALVHCTWRVLISKRNITLTGYPLWKRNTKRHPHVRSAMKSDNRWTSLTWSKNLSTLAKKFEGLLSMTIFWLILCRLKISKASPNRQVSSRRTTILRVSDLGCITSKFPRGICNKSSLKNPLVKETNITSLPVARLLCLVPHWWQFVTHAPKIELTLSTKTLQSLQSVKHHQNVKVLSMLP